MHFRVSVSPQAASMLPLHLQQKLARRAGRKVLRMGRTAATVIFPGPNDLRVIVHGREALITITLAHESLLGTTRKLMRKSA